MAASIVAQTAAGALALLGELCRQRHDSLARVISACMGANHVDTGARVAQACLGWRIRAAAASARGLSGGRPKSARKSGCVCADVRTRSPAADRKCCARACGRKTRAPRAARVCLCVGAQTTCAGAARRQDCCARGWPAEMWGDRRRHGAARFGRWFTPRAAVRLPACLVAGLTHVRIMPTLPLPNHMGASVFWVLALGRGKVNMYSRVAHLRWENAGYTWPASCLHTWHI